MYVRHGRTPKNATGNAEHLRTPRDASWLIERRGTGNGLEQPKSNHK
jgi:hypothetical protein